MWIGSARILSLKLSSGSLRKVWYHSSKCLLSNAESSWLSKCCSLCNAHPQAHTPLAALGSSKSARRQGSAKGKTNWPSFLDGQSHLVHCSFTVFFDRGVQYSLIYSLWLSLVELHQNPCLGSILTLHSDVRSYLLVQEGNKWMFRGWTAALAPSSHRSWYEIIPGLLKAGHRVPGWLGAAEGGCHSCPAHLEAGEMTVPPAPLPSSPPTGTGWEGLIRKDLQWSRCKPLV